jgi:hyperosmotically inducible protein
VKEQVMMSAKTSFGLYLASAGILAGGIAVAGCSGMLHPDEQAAVYKSLNSHYLSSVMVDQDRRSGVMKLNGVVGGTDRKARAEQLAKEAAPDYTIQDNLRVDTSGIQGMISAAASKSELDSAIEDHFKASIKAHKDLDRQSIQYWANGGTLTLKGAVKSEREKREAEDLAKKVPQVQHVVNDLEVKS